MKPLSLISRNLCLGLVSILLLLSFQSQASSVSIFGGTRFSEIKHSNTPRTQTEIGGTVQFDLLPFWQLELGMLFSSQKNLLSSFKGTQGPWKWGVMKIPVWYVFTPIHWISAGFGAYASLPTTIQPTSPLLSQYGVGISSMASFQYPLGLRFLARILFSYQWGLVGFGGNSLVQSFKDRHWNLVAGITLELF